MSHQAIEDGALIEQYVNGTLPQEELAPLEEHLLECAACLERLQWTERLKDGLRALAAEEAGVDQRHGARRVGRPSTPWLALAASMAAALLGGGLLLRSREGLQRQLVAQQVETSTWRERYEVERRQREKAATPEPLANVPVLLLSAVRGGPPRELPAVDLRPGQTWLLVSLELEPDAAFVSYGARLQGPDGRRLWSISGLRPERSAATILLPAELILPGRHVVELDGLRADGRSEPVSAYGFAARRP